MGGGGGGGGKGGQELVGKVRPTMYPNLIKKKLFFLVGWRVGGGVAGGS